MERKNDKSKVRIFRSPLSPRDWTYVLSLLVPFVVYDLFLKASLIVSRPNSSGLFGNLDLMWSDILFDLGYVLLWIGLFVAVRRGPLRWAVVVLFHVSTMLLVIVTVVAYQYFRENGTTLDYGTIAEWVPKFGEIVPILVYDVPLLAWGLLAAALFYSTLGPFFVSRAVGWWRGWPKRPTAGSPRTSLLGSLGFCILALGFGWLSLVNGTTTLERDPFVNVVLTGYEEAKGEEVDPDSVPAVEPPVNASLAQTPDTEKRNVVLIHLESTRAQSVTPYNEDLETTPFLDELAKSSLLAERAYTTVPRSSKASVSVNCGIEPPLYPGPEFEPNGIPSPCLADLLKEQGYDTAFFASTSSTMDNFGDVVQGFGYEEFYPVETMDTTGFQVTNTFGYEDDIMLGPSEQWLENRDRSRPFLAEYFTGTGHYGYECSSLRTGMREYVEDDERVEDDEELNRYLNCLRYLDSFVERLFDQYKEMGLYEDTIFVVFGDHGEGFGEHGRFLHGDTPYEEGVRVPLMIHDPKRFQGGERVEGLSSQIDILPTVLEMLGYEVRNGEYPGYSLLREPPEDRALMFSCISNRKCLASIQGYEKYIYHYDNEPDELFDLSEDPTERDNVAGRYPPEELDERRRELLEWRAGVNSMYGTQDSG